MLEVVVLDVVVVSEVMVVVKVVVVLSCTESQVSCLFLIILIRFHHCNNCIRGMQLYHCTGETAEA